MKTISSSLQFFLNVAKIQSVIVRRFDASLNGLSLTELMILLHLHNVENQKMRRIDLAEKVGLTASGITRLLAPMEKIGLVKREATVHDARVSFVALASGGKSKLEESLDRAEVLAEDLIPPPLKNKAEKFSATLMEIASAIL